MRLFMPVANQPITWLWSQDSQLTTFSHVEAGEYDLLKFKVRIRKTKKRGLKWLWTLVKMVVWRRTGPQVWAFHKLLIYWDLRTGTTISRVYEGRSKKEGISSEWQLCWRKVPSWCQGSEVGMGRLIGDRREATETQNPTARSAAWHLWTHANSKPWTERVFWLHRETLPATNKSE